MKLLWSRQRDQLRLAVLAVACITGLTALAIHKGLDGVIFGAAIAGITGVVGFMFGLKVKPPTQ